MRDVKIYTMTGNMFTVTYFDGAPFSVSWKRPINVRDELELLCRNDRIGNFVLERYYAERSPA